MELICPWCKECYSDIKEFVKHQKSHDKDEGFHYLCNICQYSSAIAGNFQRHMKGHYGIKPYQCYQCGHSFLENSKLKRHALSCNTKKKYIYLKK